MTVDLVLGFYTRARLFLIPRRPSPTFYILIPPGRCRCFVTSFLSRALLLQRAKAAVIDKAWPTGTETCVYADLTGTSEDILLARACRGDKWLLLVQRYVANACPCDSIHGREIASLPRHRLVPP